MTPEEKQIYLDKMSDVAPVEIPVVKPSLNKAFFFFWACTLGFIAGNLFVLYWG